MRLADFLFPVMPNPDVVGQVRITADDIDPERAQALDEKLERAKQYLNDRGLSMQPLYKTRQQ